ncbi:MAG: SGNH/GDSL hydrolase family protein [Planctomycetota bacterium]
MRRKKLLLAAISGAVALGLVEVALRLSLDADGTFFGRPLPPFGAVNHAAQRSWLAARQAPDGWAPRIGSFDAELGWTVTPDRRDRIAGVEIRTNSLAARGAREYAAAPPAGTTRLLCFGDSYTFCIGVADADTWQAQLEALDDGVEAINFGVGAYGVDQALLRFRRVGPALRPDALCIGIMLENIGRHVNRYRPVYFPQSPMPFTKPRFVLRDDRLELLPSPYATGPDLARAIADGSVIDAVRDGEYWLEPAPPLAFLCTSRLLAGWFAYARRREWSALWQATDGEPFRVTLALLEAFHREALTAGARAAPVLVFPSQMDLEWVTAGNAPFWTTLTDALRARGIEFLDLSPALLAALGDRPPAAFYFGGHLVPEGNAVVAREVLAWTRRRLGR